MAANIPGLVEDRMKMSYNELFMYTLIWNVGLASMAAVGVWLILMIVKWRVAKISPLRAEDNKESVITSQPSETGLTQQPLLQTTIAGLPTWKKIIRVLTSVFFYLILVSAAVIFLAAFMFGVMGYGIVIDVIAVLIMTAIVAVPTVVWKMLTRTRSHQQMKKEYIVAGIMLLVWLGLSVLGVALTSRACLCVFNDRYGVTVQKNYQLSTQFTRASRGKICKDGAICHVYATLPEDTDTSVFLNIQTGTDIQNVTVSMLQITDSGPASPSLGDYVQATKFAVGETLEFNGQRNLFTILFSSLRPETTYAVQVVAGTAVYNTRYRTLPSFSSNTGFRVAFGGDIGMTKLGSQLTELLAAPEYDLDVVIIGGDISYDDAMSTCYYSWDNFYEIFEGLNSKLGRLVPMILTVGNHDVGFDALATVTVKPDKEGPFFFAYHPQHYLNSTQRSGIPPPQNRSSVHYHRLGKILMVNLDSGYLKGFEEQKKFIEDISNAHPGYQKIANYHNPIYPTCSDTSNQLDMMVLNQSRTYWTPLFDKYRFVAAMEHHTHHLKYTFPINDGKRNDANGTVYIGDGCWGVPNEPCSNRQRVSSQLFDEYDNDNSEHVWMMTVGNNQLDFRAIDGDGNTRIRKTRPFRT